MEQSPKKITILVPEEIVDAIKRIASQERRSMNQEMIRALEEHIKQHQPKDKEK